jgi:hypothetical protein
VILLIFLGVAIWRFTAPAIPEKEDVEALQVAITELLPVALEQEKTERATLLKEVRKRSQRVADFLEGTPSEIADAQTQMLETTRSFEAESDALRAPAEAAATTIDEAVAASASFVGDMGLHRYSTRCGGDGCGGECPKCPLEQLCVDLFCHCVPACGNRECGSDGCGGRCGKGVCGEDERCDDAGRCSDLESLEICTPNCRTTPAGPHTQVVTGSRDHGVTRQGARFQPYPHRDAAAEIRDRLTQKSQSLRAQTQAHRDRGEKIRALQNNQIPSLQESLKGLNATLAARRTDLKTTTDTDPAAQNALQVLSHKVDQARAAMKDTRKALGVLQKAQARDERKMSGLVEAEHLSAAEAARLTAHIAAWDTTLAKLEGARKAQSLAIQAAMAPLAAIASKWEPRISTAQGEVSRLESKALDLIALDWDDDSPTHAVSPNILRHTEPNPLTRYRAGVMRIHKKYMNWWNSASPESREAQPHWQMKTAELAGLLVYLDELSASTRRVVDLRDALLHAREQSAY